MNPNLSEFLFKKVSVRDNSGIVYSGVVIMYESALDNENGEESIGILTDEKRKSGIELYRSEIESISVVD